MSGLGGTISVDGQPVRGVVDYNIGEGWIVVTEKSALGRPVSDNVGNYRTRRIYGRVSVVR